MQPRKDLVASGIAALAVALVLAAGSADAKGRPGGEDPSCANLEPSVCGYQLTELCGAIEASTSLKDRDENGMVSKVLGAAIKLNQDKPEDAAVKLGQIESKLAELEGAAKPKISEADADAISAALIPAQLCVDTVE